MDEKDPTIELLNSLEQIVFKDTASILDMTPKSNLFVELAQLKQRTGLADDDFARVLGVSLNTVQEWEARRVIPSITELKLIRLIAHVSTRTQLIA